MALLHVSAYDGHLQGGGYQRKQKLWLILLDICRYKANICVLHKLHGKMSATWNRLHVFVCIMILIVVQMQTNIYVCVVQGLFLCAQLSISTQTVKSTQGQTLNKMMGAFDFDACLYSNNKKYRDTCIRLKLQTFYHVIYLTHILAVYLHISNIISHNFCFLW